VYPDPPIADAPTDPSDALLPGRSPDGLIATWYRDFSRQRAGRPLLWDGGVGTGLIARGLVLGQAPPEAWLLTRPAEVQAVHAEFAAAGADVLQTNSFGLVRLLVEPAGWHGPPPPLPELVRQSVRLARAGAAAGSGRPIVIGSLGPTGRADGDEGALAAAYGAVASAFVAAGVRTLHLETCLDPRELQLALRGMREATPELEILVSLTLNMGQSGPETPLGVPLSRMLRELDRAPEPPALIGVNCGQPARRLHAAVAALFDWAGGRLPVLVQPQVGEPAPDCRVPARPETPERFARDLIRLLDEGAVALGGCCGATGAHLQAVQRALALLSPSPSPAPAEDRGETSGAKTALAP
jgi:methionine synthase I (cobalamin-dependent)